MTLLKTFFDKPSLKSRKATILFILIFASCCSSDPELYGSLSINATADKQSFIFSVKEQFSDSNIDSSPDKENPIMTKLESSLLEDILKRKKYCLNAYGYPTFAIVSKQEKIYDMTFAHLIEENYNARPITPRMYFGHCLSK